MKYKIGDRVRIKSLDWYNENKDQHGQVNCGYHVFTEDMSKFCGYTMIVSNITNLGVMYLSDSADYWTDEMIEGLANEHAKEHQEKMVSLDEVCDMLYAMLDTHQDVDGYDYVTAPAYDTVEDLVEDFRKSMEKSVN